MRNQKGQSILEYTIILVIILAVLITMKDYIKRGFQGRWKSAADDMGDQYDPRFVNSSTNYSTEVNSLSLVSVSQTQLGTQNGQYTNRIDLSNSSETKTGYSQIGD
jgi:Flp pilus assembly pilin Flp